MTDEFTPIDSLANNGKSRTVSRSANVIKNSRVLMKDQFIINSDNETDIGTIEPILEGDIVVGIKYRCRCGREAEIHFEYAKAADTMQK